MKQVHEIDREKLMRSPDGELYQVIGFILDPAVILRRVRDHHQQVVIPTAPIAEEWIEVEAAEAQAELLNFLRERL